MKVTFVILILLLIPFYFRTVKISDGPDPEKIYWRRCVDKQVDAMLERNDSNTQEKARELFFESIKQCEVRL